ncbi:unnamed protein product [Mytilus edulis]|uniref:Uncharacterized protein n=1 Tax=Mytilus edulis TaxID=6550 RepID=A0A8S3UT05_MYTED|nr:unnamed protein product [Mytilus edulis]
MKTETHSKILLNLAWEAVKPTYNEKTDIHEICQMSLNDAKKDDHIDEEDNILPIFGEFGSIIETDNNLSSAFTVEDTIMASNLRTIVPSTVFQLPLSSINISPFLPFCEIPPKPSSTPSSGVFVHSSLITTHTPPPSPSASTSSITSVIPSSSQSSTTIFQSSDFPTMHHSLSYQKFEVMVSLPFSSPLIQTAAVTVASPLFQTSAIIVASPLLHTAVLVVSSPRLQTCAMIPSYQSIQTSSLYVLPYRQQFAEMLHHYSSENSAIMLSVLSLPSLWTQAETKNKQHTNSRLSTEPDQLQIQPPQQYIPSININEISFEHSDNGNIKVLGKGATAEVLQGNLHNDCWVKKIAIKLLLMTSTKTLVTFLKKREYCKF